MKGRVFPICLMMGLVSASSEGLAATIQGIGGRDCTAFMRSTEIGSEQAIDAYVAWSQGYLSAWNDLNRQGSDVVVDHAGLVYWLTTYCGGKPQTPFYEAIKAFIQEQGT